MVATDGGDELALYAEATGLRLDDTAMLLYRVRWQLDDISNFVGLLMSPHENTADTEKAWLGLTRHLEDLDRSSV